jgi:hypothetical protein
MIFILPQVQRLQRSIREKGAEWLSSVFMLGWAAALAMPGNTFAAPQFAAFFRAPFMTEEFWAAVFGAVGGMRIVALYLNGDSPTRGPRCRTAGAAFGFISWTQVSLMLLEATAFRGEPVSTGAIVYATVAFFDSLAILWIASDASYQRK